MYVDMHNHLKPWSPDAVHTVEELIAEAQRKGLDGIAVTDHYDIGSFIPADHEWIFDTDAYVRENGKFRRAPSERKPGDAVGFLVGIEMSYEKRNERAIHELIHDRKFDAGILSLHTDNGLDPVRNRVNITDEKELGEYYSHIIGLIACSSEQIPEADIIGHYDFFSRYIPLKKSKMMYRHAPAAFDRLFNSMIRNGQALEINTGTVENLHLHRGYSVEEAMPDPEIIERYEELGGSLISLGSDAHCTAAVARYIPQTAQWLKSRGVKTYCWFEKHRTFTRSI